MEHFFALEACQQENDLKKRKFENIRYENLWILERLDCIYKIEMNKI
jgi:hypothetical protein